MARVESACWGGQMMELAGETASFGCPCTTFARKRAEHTGSRRQQLGGFGVVSNIVLFTNFIFAFAYGTRSMRSGLKPYRCASELPWGYSGRWRFIKRPLEASWDVTTGRSLARDGPKGDTATSRRHSPFVWQRLQKPTVYQPLSQTSRAIPSAVPDCPMGVGGLRRALAPSGRDIYHGA
jgi:hypothetical protein